MADPSNEPPGEDPAEEAEKQQVQQKTSLISNEESERKRRQDGRSLSAPVSGGPSGTTTSQRTDQSTNISPSESQIGRPGTGSMRTPRKSIGGASPARVRAEAIRNSQRAALDSVVVQTPQREAGSQTTGGRARGESYTWKSKRFQSTNRHPGMRHHQQQQPSRRSATERHRLGAPDHRRVATATADSYPAEMEESDSDDEDATLEQLRNRQRVRAGYLRRISSDSNQWNILKGYMLAMNLKVKSFPSQDFVPEEHEVRRFWDIKVSEEDARFLEAVRHNDVDAMNAALAAGADPGARNQDGNTALHLAVEVDALSALNALLLSGEAPVSAPDTQGITPLHLAVEMGKRLLVNALIMAGASINTVDRFGRNPLHFAIIGGKVRIVKLLLYCGADPNMPDSYGTTPLSMAVLTRPFPDIARTLLMAGALVDVESGSGFYLLSEAVLACYTETHLDAIRVLLESGAEVNRQEEVSGQTPLHLAALSDNGAVAEVLVLAGADPSITNFSGETAIEMALLHGSKDVLTVLSSLAASEDMDMVFEEQHTLRNAMGSMLSEFGIGHSSEDDEQQDSDEPGQPQRQHGASGIIHSVVMQSAPIVSNPQAEEAAAKQALEARKNTVKTKNRQQALGPDLVTGGVGIVKKYK